MTEPARRTTTQYASLEAAFEDHDMTPENRAFVRDAVADIAIARIEARASYLKAVRADGGPDLQIHSGWTTGFRDDDAIVERLRSDQERCWRSRRGDGLFGVSHPVNRLREATSTRPAEPRRFGVCPSCWLELPASGQCGTCG